MTPQPTRWIAWALGALLTATVATTAVAQVPSMIPAQGTLYDAEGVAIDGDLDVRFALYADASRVVTLWTETQTVSFDAGVFSTLLGSVTPVEWSMLRDYDQLYLGIAVGSDPEMEVIPVGTAPYAGYAGYAHDAELLDGLTVPELLREAVAEAAGTFAYAAHAHAWDTITDVPAGFADGVDNDSQLTEAQVDAYVANNGYRTTDSDTQLTEAQVDAYVANNGYRTTDNDTQLTEAQVDAYVANNGYVTGSLTNVYVTPLGCDGGGALSTSRTCNTVRCGDDGGGGDVYYRCNGSCFWDGTSQSCTGTLAGRIVAP